MSKRVVIASLTVLVCLAFVLFRAPNRVEGRNAPARLTDAEFWQLAVHVVRGGRHLPFREPGLERGRLPAPHPEPDRAGGAGRAPTSASGRSRTSATSPRVRPSFAFIVDIRRGNFDLQLLYKALFELSADRADFVGRMFSRPRPAGLTKDSTAAAIFEAYARVPPNREALHPQPRAARGTSRDHARLRAVRATIAAAWRTSTTRGSPTVPTSTTS